MSLFHQQQAYDQQKWLIWSILGLFITLFIWWGLAEFLSRERPIVDYNTHLPSSLSDSSMINRDSLLMQDSINLANATEFEKIYPLLPPPNRVVSAFPKLWQDDALLSNTFLSIWRNIQGYFWAVFLALVIGFPIALFPRLRALFSQQIDAMRYLPLTALTGLFILWFGFGDSMKVAFLAFGILVYLLPVVLQRIQEVESVYLKTTFTLGATDWQTIRSVYFPSVLSKLIDDIRVLTAISWTYIIVAELLNRAGGVGAMIWVNGRQGKVDKVFAWLFVIVIVGFLQDRLFIYLDRRLFPHKYYKTVQTGIKETRYGIFLLLGSILMFLLVSVIVPWVAQLFGSEMTTESVQASLQNLLYIFIITACIATIYGEFKFQTSK